jgi:hypothetical protein
MINGNPTCVPACSSRICADGAAGKALKRHTKQGAANAAPALPTKRVKVMKAAVEQLARFQSN